MANTKKPRRLKKKVVSYSITTAVVEDFNELAEIHGFVPSNKVQQLMELFNKDLIGI